jgi:hypothetical protein
MLSDEDVWSRPGPVVDLHETSTTYRISVDVDMVPAGMTTERACGLFISALETAHTVVRHVRINQCSTLTSEGMRHRVV